MLGSELNAKHAALVRAQFGEAFTLAASAARTTGANGSGVQVRGHHRMVVLLDVTASAHEAGDTLDVFIDFSWDNISWYNGGHFAQQSGAGAAKKEIMVFDSANPGTASIAITSDAAAGAVRPAMFGRYVRARWAIVNSGDGDQSHTFSVTLWAD